MQKFAEYSAIPVAFICSCRYYGHHKQKRMITFQFSKWYWIYWLWYHINIISFSLLNWFLKTKYWSKIEKKYFSQKGGGGGLGGGGGGLIMAKCTGHFCVKPGFFMSNHAFCYQTGVFLSNKCYNISKTMTKGMSWNGTYSLGIGAGQMCTDVTVHWSGILCLHQKAHAMYA